MSRAPLTAWIDGIGFLAPGMPDWPTACAVLRGVRRVRGSTLACCPYRASCHRPSAVAPAASSNWPSRSAWKPPPNAEADVSTLATVFTASGADGHNCHALCEQLATDDRRISPTRFHNSVHNAAAGYWGIATRSMAPCQVLCAFDASLGAGLLDALGQVLVDWRPTLLIAYDSEYPEPLHCKRPVT
jgi:hypothetical protein